MPRSLTAVLSAVSIAAAFGLSGCSSDEHGSSPDTEAPVSVPALTSTATPQVAPLPPPDALVGVLYRLADPGIPGIAKLDLVEGATPEHAPVIDAFANALLENGYAPIQLRVRDIAWSDVNPGYVRAFVQIGTPKPGASGAFMFPMEFKPYHGGWQLSERTARQLLAVASPQLAPPKAPGH
jgi:hypothetical protein